MNLLQTITENQIKSKNQSGTTLPFLMQRLDISFTELRKELNTLRLEGKIIARNGLNGRLVFLKR